MRFLRRSLATRARRLILAGSVALTLFAVAGPASASVGSILDPCGQPLSQPFLPWLDPAQYAFTPNGGLESGLGGWSSSGGAAVVSDNESFAVHGSGDRYSLSLPAGASATTPSICIGTLSPTARLFVRNGGSPLSTLRVDVLYTTVLGLRVSAPVAVVVGSASWQPTLPLPLLANVTALPLLTSGSTKIALRFTAQGQSGAWQLDDVYVDPYKGT